MSVVVSDDAAQQIILDIGERELIIPLKVEEKSFAVKLAVIDTPGFGDQINNTDSHHAIVEFIDAQMEDYLLKEAKPDRNREKDKDSRVHAVVYFLYPSGHG